MSLGLGAEIQGLAAALVPGSPGTDPGLLFPLLRSSEEVQDSVGARPLSGSSFPGGLGGTRMRRRKMHFFFLISLPQRNLQVGRGRESSGVCRVHPPGEQSQALKLLSSLSWTQSGPRRRCFLSLGDQGSQAEAEDVAGGPCSPTACGGSCSSSPVSSLPQPAPKPPPLGRPPAAPSGAPFCSLRATRRLKAPPGTALIFPTPSGLL